MSKIEVNTVEPQCGTTLTLGGSGDTVALGSGASQTGFGRTGTVDWVTTPKVTGDSPVTAATGSGYFLNTTGGAITINLPAGSAGSIVSMADYAATWQTYNVTVAANGSEKIGGDTNDAILNTEGQSVTFVYVDGVQGWVNTMDSTSNVRGQVPFIVATGGNAEVTCGDYKTHIFTAPGTFCVSNLAPTAPLNVVDYFVVAGGAAGGSGRGGGGGAGGFRMFASSPGCHSPLNAPAGITVTASPYPIIVGGGGPGQASFPPVQTGGDGTLSTFDSITSAGGGGGGTGPGTGTGGWGQVGGSGGGQAFNNPGGGGGNEPPVSPPQGNPGGSSNTSGSPCAARGGGGGGGAGGAGGNTPPSGPRGIGGTGSYLGDPFIGPTAPSYGTPGPVGSTRYFAGGGGAGGQCGTGGSAPLGGGGTAGQVNAAGGCHATVNTGGGSGGAGEGTYCGPSSSPTQLIGNGGSGIVMIRYKYQ
jgi:hypothetical protein